MDDKKKVWKSVMVGLLVCALMGIVGLVAYSVGAGNAPEQKSVVVNDLFVDMDGDGDLDYVPYAEIVFNTEVVQENPNQP